MDGEGNGGGIAAGSIVDERFELIETIGGGRRGHVWRAKRLEDDKPVVIKLLDSAVATDEQARSRFEREAEAASRVAHPNCAGINDVGALPDGRLFLVTDYFDGELLSSYLLRKQKLPLRDALRIARHLLCGLRHAHGTGVVHRDVRPGNVMLVERDGERNVAILLDFGLAKLIGDAGAGKQALTTVGLALGDISYAAPEQLSGGTIDGRADLYAITAVIVQMLTGKPPSLEADTPPQEGIDAPLKVKELIRWGLERDRTRRIPSTDRFITEIDSVLGDRAPSVVPTIVAPTVPPPEPVRAEGTAGPDSATMHAPAVSQRPPMPAWVRKVAIGVGAGLLLLGIAAGASQCEDTDALLGRYTRELRTGKTCEARRAAVLKLEQLGDERAVPALRRARERDGNRCLLKDARDAIAHLKAR